MLIIRNDQMLALSQRALSAFEDEMVLHLRGHASRLFELRGEPCMRQLAQRGMAKARDLGFTRRGPVRLVIELMLALGSEFDTDPQHELLLNPLRADPQADPMARAEELFARVTDYFAHVIGAERQHALQALRRVRQQPLDRLVPDGATPFLQRAAASLHALYPQKAAFIGADAIARLVAGGTAAAAAEGLDDERGAAAMVGLMFGFGHGVASDPMYPWVRNTLDRPGPPERKLRQLASKTLVYIEGMLSHLGPSAAGER